jgi:hypothetical protein
MLILREAWDEFSSKSLSSEEKDALDSHVTSAMLEFMGFEFKGEGVSKALKKDDAKEYNLKYVHPELEGVVVWSNGDLYEMMPKLEIKGKEAYVGFSIRRFFEELAKKGLVLNGKAEEIAALHPSYPTLLSAKRWFTEEVEESLPKPNKSGKQLDKARAEYDAAMTSLRMMDCPNILRYGDRYARPTVFEKLYAKKFSTGIYDDLFMRMHTLEYNMAHINKIWAPTWHGLQYMDHEAFSTYLAKTARIHSRIQHCDMVP